MILALCNRSGSLTASRVSGNQSAVERLPGRPLEASPCIKRPDHPVPALGGHEPKALPHLHLANGPTVQHIPFVSKNHEILSCREKIATPPEHREKSIILLFCAAQGSPRPHLILSAMIDQPALRRILAPRRPSLSKLPRLIAGEKPSCLISIPGQAHPVDGSSWIIFPTHSPERTHCGGSARPDRAC